jgi:gentisate 1,2-dioxygenase
MPDAAYAAPGILPRVTLGRRDHSPLFRYPYADAVRALAQAPVSPDGLRWVRYANPLDGGNAMALLEAAMVQVDAGVVSLPTRSNANLVVTVVAGEGESLVGDRRVTWSARDVFTVPQQNWVRHRAIGGDARLFVVSDGDALRRLGLLVEETQAAAAAMETT